MSLTTDFAAALVSAGYDGALADPLLSILISAGGGYDITEMGDSDVKKVTAQASNVAVLSIPGLPFDWIIGAKVSTLGWMLWHRTARMGPDGKTTITDSPAVWVAGDVGVE